MSLLLTQSLAYKFFLLMLLNLSFSLSQIIKIRYLYNFKNSDLDVQFLWVPDYTRISVNEMEDSFAKFMASFHILLNIPIPCQILVQYWKIVLENFNSTNGKIFNHILWFGIENICLLLHPTLVQQINFIQKIISSLFRL